MLRSAGYESNSYQTLSVTIIYHNLVGITNLSVDLVSDRDLDRFESVQNVEL